MKRVICSHGFGVRADDRGLFTAIADALPEHSFTMFDYNNIDAEGNIFVRPLMEQAKLLEDQIAMAGGKVTLLCHSQGCIIASLADLQNVEKIIFLAPPGEMSIERFMAKVASREGNVFNPTGISILHRSDGTKTHVDETYIRSIKNFDVEQKYMDLASKHDLTIIRAAVDEVIGETDFSYLSSQVIILEGGHNFLPPHREALVKTVNELLG